MALQKVLHSTPDTPYSRPPPIHITVLEQKEQARVFAWTFEDGDARPSVTKVNTVAIISDGCSLAKITLYETFASKVKPGQGYVMRGYNLRGDCPPYGINVTKDTMFFRSAPVEVAGALKDEAKKLLCPISQLTPISDLRKAEGLLTIQGEVMELSAIKRMQVGKDPVPFRTVAIKEDQAHITVNLWREAAVLPLQVGAHTRLTHLKKNESAYGFRLQSTLHTDLENTIETEIVAALGVLDWEGRPGILKLLIQGDKFLEIEEALWLPLEKNLLKLPFYLKISLSGKKIITAEAVEQKED